MEQPTEYSTKKISSTLVSEIKKALKSVKEYGSVELYIQDNKVTQITVRTITKTQNSLKRDHRNP